MKGHAMARPKTRNTYAEEMAKARKAEARAKTARRKAEESIKRDLFRGFKARSAALENQTDPAAYVWEMFDLGVAASAKSNKWEGQSKFAKD